MIKFDVTRDFSKGLKHYISDLGGNIPKIFHNQMGLLVRQMEKFTWPKTKAQGEKAVARDIDHAQQLITEKSFDNFKGRAKQRGKQLVRERNVVALNALYQKLGMRVEVLPFSEKIHQDARDRRGRVPKPTGKATLDADAHSSYVKTVQARVGWARAGWRALADKLGVKLAAWATRHGSKGGTATGNPLDPENPNVAGINNPAGLIPGYEAQVGAACRARARAMAADTERKIKAGARHAGFTIT